MHDPVGSTHKTASVGPFSLTFEIASLAVVEEQFAIACDRGKQIPIRRVRNVSDKSSMVRNHLVVFKGNGRVQDYRVVV